MKVGGRDHAPAALPPGKDPGSWVGSKVGRYTDYAIPAHKLVEYIFKT